MHPLIAELVAIRENLGLTRVEAGTRAALGEATIRSWDRGRNDPSITGADVYARGLGYRLALVPVDAPELSEDEREELAREYATTVSPQLAVAVREQDAGRIAELIGALDGQRLRVLSVTLAELVMAALAERTPLTPGQARAREERVLARSAERVRRRINATADDADELLDALGIEPTKENAA